MIKNTLSQSLIQKTTLATILGSAFFIAGCTTPPVVVQPTSELPDSAYIVPKDLTTALDRSEKRIKANVTLLRELNGQKPIAVEPVTHVNNFDARSEEDKRKIRGPQFGKKAPESVAPSGSASSAASQNNVPASSAPLTPATVAAATPPTAVTASPSLNGTNGATTPQPLEKAGDIVGTDNAKVAKLNAPIKSVVWKNSSLNEFVKKIGGHVGYGVMIVDRNGNPVADKDVQLNLEENDKSSLYVLNKIAQMNSSKLSIAVSHVRQKILVSYK